MEEEKSKQEEGQFTQEIPIICHNGNAEENTTLTNNLEACFMIHQKIQKFGHELKYILWTYNRNELGEKWLAKINCILITINKLNTK